MGETLYLECRSGISGDMTVAALLDLGADETVLRNALASLPLDGYRTAVTRVKKSGLDVCDFAVIPDSPNENHDHDMAYLHGAADSVPSDSVSHPHTHRTLPDVLSILHGGSLTPRAERTACTIFQILAEAEAKAHGTTAENVSFHEVGAVDSIVDIVSAAVCLDNLNVTQVIVEELCDGRGSIRCRHGVLPIPVPAVANIAQAYALPLTVTQTYGELVTPTGAAIAAAVRTSDSLPKRFHIKKIGMGAGKRAYDCPGILRAMLLEADAGEDETGDIVTKLETNVDDCTGEMLGRLAERLTESGALDVAFLPLYMKKNRPGYLIQVLCRPKDVTRMENLLFTETTTIGIRRVTMERRLLPRVTRTVTTALGTVRVKECRLPNETRLYPEYEDAVRLCKKYGISYYEICRMIQSSGSSTD